MSWVAAAAGALALVLAPGPVTAARRVGRWRPARWATDVVRRGATPRVLPVAARLPLLVGLALALVAAAVGGAAGAVLGCGLGVAGGAAVARWGDRIPGHGGPGRPRPDPLAEAGAWDQLAACLRAGLPLDRAVRAVAPLLPAGGGAALTRVADLAVLGADPVAAWEPALAEPSTSRLARAARRSARSGSAVADVAATVASDVRGEAADAVAARAERAGVLVTGPLGLCFLPAFLALGIVPVVAGLAGPLLEQR